MATESQRPAILSSNTLVPLGAFLLVSVGGYQVYDSLRLEIREGNQSNRDDIRDVREDVRSLRTEINSKTDDRWRRTDTELLMSDLYRKNPTLVPASLPSR